MAIQKPKSITLLSMTLMVTLVLAACTGVWPTDSSTGISNNRVGTVRLTAFAPQSLPENYYPSARMENEGLIREIPLERFSGGFTAEATNLPVGDWSLIVELRDQSGNLTHVGEEKVRVYPETESFVQVHVQPVDGTFEIVADLTDFPEKDSIEGVRVTLSPGGYFTLVPVEDTPYLFHGERGVQAGDYEFSVALYGESFYAADRLYQSPWESVRFYSGQTVQMSWSPTYGSTEVRIDIAEPPGIPGGVQCSYTPDGMLVTWDVANVPPDGMVRIYVRADEFRPYSLIGEADAATGSWLIDPKHETVVSIVLTNVNARGDESFRSAPIIPDECMI